jgi:serine/threonine-protein kinase
MIAIGSVLNGRYRLVTLLAVGGMGQVWQGHDEELDLDIAVKVLKEDAGDNAVFLKRFEIEARNAAALSHRNICQVLDYGEHEGNAYMIMELVDGESLASILEREVFLDERRLVTILIHTCHGLQAAHEAGIIHRDVKPGNLLIQPDDMVKITDFGVSRARDQTTLTQTGMVMGTAQYLAPELALGRPATPQSDIYALGIIAFEALVGKRPFTAATPVEIAVSQVNDPVPPLPDSITPGLAALVVDLLCKDPKRRPASADRLAGLLGNLRLPSVTERRLRNRTPPQSIAPRHKGGAPGRAMPPTVSPKDRRRRPDA